MSLHVVILAAGLGRRMHSNIPKVLHKLGGKPMLTRVVETALALKPKQIHVIISRECEPVKTVLTDLPVNWVRQTQPFGTGHALMQALPDIPKESQVLVLSADVPLIQANTLRSLLKRCEQQALTSNTPLGLLLAQLSDPSGLGRIVRDDQGKILAIVEEKDATEKQRQINEIYTGICLAPAAALNRWLPKLNNNNAQGEYYLTGIIAMAVDEAYPIASTQAHDHLEILGVNNRLQLQQLERACQRQLTQKLMLSGVTLADATRVDIRGELTCGTDVFIDINTIFEGKIVMGDGCSIGPNCVLNNVTLGNHCNILANTVLENCYIGDQCQIGPFARLRPGTQLASNCKIGNFVETKNAVLDAGSKASHLSYLGDVNIGKNVNIGAGTITCNYDGANKHQTRIEDGVFVGSDTQFVAPVTVGENATIGAGSTIRMDVPPNELTLTESKQTTIYGWMRPEKKG